MGLTDALKSLFSGSTAGTISFDDLAKAVSEKTVHVVDVREPAEFASGHVPNALNMPLAAFNPAKLPTSLPVVLICQAGGRSARVLSAARSAGRSDVVHFAGGTGGWRSMGGRIE